MTHQPVFAAGAILLSLTFAACGDGTAHSSQSSTPITVESPSITQPDVTQPSTTPPSETPIDWQRVPPLIAKQRSGQTLTPDELAFVRHVQAARQKLMAAGQWPPKELHGSPLAAPPTPNGNNPAIALTPHDSTGLIPLTQMQPGELYKGQDGGLYGHGSNTPPPTQEKLARDAARLITPLDPQGNPSKDGSIALISVGISNTTMEFAHFLTAANQDPAKNPQLKLVDCAHGGRDATMWADPKRQELWDFVAQRLRDAHVTDQQVQACWIKLCLAGPDKYGPFPQSSDLLRDDIITVLGLLKTRFPHLQLAYLSSRTYGGYCLRDSNPEPFAYEGAFAVRGAIQQQIQGNPKLTLDKSPVLLWGPYLWADGVKGRALDDLVYTRADYLASDGTHPTDSGKQKITQQLLYFFKSDPTSRPWFCRPDAPQPAQPNLK